MRVNAAQRTRPENDCRRLQCRAVLCSPQSPHPTAVIHPAHLRIQNDTPLLIYPQIPGHKRAVLKSELAVRKANEGVSAGAGRRCHGRCCRVSGGAMQTCEMKGHTIRLLSCTTCTCAIEAPSRLGVTYPHAVASGFCAGRAEARDESHPASK
jgi:hypothetical protein